jgi:hypothetical protein
LTPKTAFSVISVREEYMVVNYLGYKAAGSQVLAREEGKTFDKLTVEDPATKKKFDLYFNIDRFFGKF